MIRFVTIATFSAFLLLGATVVSAETPLVSPEGAVATPMVASPYPMSAGPSSQKSAGPTGGFFGSIIAPQRYRPTPPSNAGSGYAPPYDPAQGMMPNGAYPPGYGSPQGYSAEYQEQRIVYVPYAMPPPIHVERLGKALPSIIVRRTLGQVNLYEYPEMPMRTYTTRGPRDFLATNPPSIGY